MTRTLRSIAAAVVAFSAASSFAAMPAAGEFSAVDQVQAPASVNLTRDTVRNEAVTAAQSAYKANGEIVQEAAASGLTRAEAREQGRTALRSHTMPVGGAL